MVTGDYPPVHKLYLIDKPLKGKPLLERASTWVKLIYSQLRFVGPTFFLRHRRAVLLPLASKVSLRLIISHSSRADQSARQFCIALKKAEGVDRIGMIGCVARSVLAHAI
jgi:hypothetical protein